MNELVASIGNDTGKMHVEKLISSYSWDNIIIVKFDGEEFAGIEKKHKLISVNKNLTSEQLAEHLKKELQTQIKGTQIGINFFSGSGKLHMAMMSALLKLGLGIRLVVVTPEGIKEI